jgi:hypothetical protein
VGVAGGQNGAGSSTRMNTVPCAVFERAARMT